MVLSKEADRLRKEKQRRSQGTVARRVGKDALSANLRWKKHMFTSIIQVMDCPVVPVLPTPLVALHDVATQRLRLFDKYANDAPRGDLFYRDDPGVLLSVKAVEGVPRQHVFKVLMRYWRLDNASTWRTVGDLLRRPCPNWTACEALLRGLPRGSTAASEHRTYVDRRLIGLSIGEHHVVILRAWSASRLGPAARLSGERQARCTLTDAMRQVSRLEGAGPYTGVCMAGSLMKLKLVRWDHFGVLGPGGVAGARRLLGEDIGASSCRGYWPWEPSSAFHRGLVGALARRYGIHWMDCQHRLCNWLSA